MLVLASRRQIIRAAVRREEPPAGIAILRSRLPDGTVRQRPWRPLSKQEKAAIARSFVRAAEAGRRERDAHRAAEMKARAERRAARSD